MVTLEDYLMARDVDYPLNYEQQICAADIVVKLMDLELAYGSLLTITSGYRPAVITNELLGGDHHDAHEKCCGVDLRDTDQKLYAWCVANIEKLIEIGFWMESIVSAKDHVHLQTYAPGSGNRIFIA